MDAETERRLKAIETQLRELRTLPIRSIDLLLYAPVIDHFWGDSIDARWNTAVAGSGVAPALQSTAPSRILFSTGATSGSQSQLNENNVYKWSAANAFTLITRVKLSALTSITAHPTRVTRVAGTDQIILGFTAATSATKYVMTSTAASSTTTLVTGVDADSTDFHTLALSVTSSYVRGRIDGNAYAEITTNIPTVDMQILSLIANTAAADKQMEMDYLIMIPGYNLF